MTGINLPGSGRPRKDESPSEKYSELKQVPERYSIIQLGVSLFEKVPEEEDEDGEIRMDEQNDNGRIHWRVRRYNFYVFPDQSSERDVVMSPGAVAFLNKYNMSFDQWVKKGVPFTDLENAAEVLESYAAEQADADEFAKLPPKSPTIQHASRRVELRRVEDVEFFSRCMASLREWLDSPIGRQERMDPEVLEGACFMLPACNSFMRRAFYEAIQQEYPSLILENAGPDNPNRIRVWRLDDDEKKRRDERLRREAWEDVITNKIGLTRVYAAISSACRGKAPHRRSVLFAPSIDNVDWTLPPLATTNLPETRRIPVVVHNGFMDISFMLSHFVSPQLPPSLKEYKKLLATQLPLIYDTKLMATECSPSQHNLNTVLGSLFERVSPEAGLLGRIETMTTSPDAPPDQEHEAAYDAFMTGVCFIALWNEIQNLLEHDLLSNSLHEGKSHRILFGRNQLYQMSMYTMDLENLESDPMSRGMLPEATYRVSGIDPAVSTRDIVRCLAGLNDDVGRRVMFELVWIDDTTFLVSASYREADTGLNLVAEEATLRVIREHGLIIQRALARRFVQGEKVQPLPEYLATLETQHKQEANPSIFSRLASLFGFGTKRRAEDETTQPQSKRRRLN